MQGISNPIDPVDSAELARLNQENEMLQKRLHTLSSRLQKNKLGQEQARMEKLRNKINEL